MTAVLAFDPANKTGWAYRAKDGRWRHGTLQPLDVMSVVRVLDRAYADGVDLTVIESCYLGHSPAAMRELARYGGALESAAMLRGMTVQYVNPTTWKQSMLCVNGAAPQKRADQKRAAMTVARMLGASPKCHDEADAVCLAEWAGRAAEQERRAK